MNLQPPPTPHDKHGVPLPGVWLRQGKAANKTKWTFCTFTREDATLCEQQEEGVPPTNNQTQTDDTSVDSECNVKEEAR